VLVMSVDPGFGGQRFIETSVAKLRAARDYLPASVALEVDGGVDDDNVARSAAAGANLLVAGSSVFSGGRASERYAALDAILRG